MNELTVGEVIDALSKYPRDARVLMDDGQGWWRNVAAIVGPGVVFNPDTGVDEIVWDEDDDYSLPTILMGEEHDARSL